MVEGMARPCLLKLTAGQRRGLLQHAERSADAGFRDACRAALALAAGEPRSQVARTMGVHPATVGRWALAYRRRGVEGLRGPVEDGRGRPRKLQTEDLVWLKQTILTSPRDVGYAFAVWSLPRLARYLEQERGVSVRPHYLGHLLRRAGLTRLRPQHVLEGKRDEAAQDRAKAELARIKRRLAQDPTGVISQDETELHLYAYRVAIWCVVGLPQPHVPTPGKNRKRVLYGGLNLKTGRLVAHGAPTKSGAHFIEYLATLLRACPHEQILLITDNGSFQHTRKVAALLAEHQDRLEVKWLRPYGPDLNDIERTWRRLKASHAANFLFNSLDQLAANVQKGIEEMNAAAGK